jgi:hypothetical protein
MSSGQTLELAPRSEGAQPRLDEGEANARPGAFQQNSCPQGLTAAGCPAVVRIFRKNKSGRVRGYSREGTHEIN